MIPQRESDGSVQEQVSPTYRNYEGNQEYMHQQDEIPYGQSLGERSGEKVYSPLSDKKTMLRLLWFAVAMIALLLFAVICLILVGGTAGWISFVAASFTIMVIVTTALAGMPAEKTK
jgi:hypothetical protein